MFPLGVASRKGIFIGQRFSLNHTTATLYDTTGRHTVQTGSGVTSSGGFVNFTTGSAGVTILDNASNDFDVSRSKMGDFDITFKFRLTADSDTLSILFAVIDPNSTSNLHSYCYIGSQTGGKKVSIVGWGVSLIHPTVQVVGAAEQTLLFSRRGATYTLTIDGVSVSGDGGSEWPTYPNALLIGGYILGFPIYDFIGTIRNFSLTSV